MISSPLDGHKAPHTQINEPQYQTRYQQDIASRNETKQTPEPETCTPKMQKEDARDDPRRNQELPVNTTAGDRTDSLEALRKEQTETAPKGGNQKATGQPERQDRIT